MLAARNREGRKSQKRRMQEPAKPNALALALFTDAIHAVIPVTGSH